MVQIAVELGNTAIAVVASRLNHFCGREIGSRSVVGIDCGTCIAQIQIVGANIENGIADEPQIASHGGVGRHCQCSDRFVNVQVVERAVPVAANGLVSCAAKQNTACGRV